MRVSYCAGMLRAFLIHTNKLVVFVSDTWVYVEVVIVKETGTITFIPRECLSSDVHVCVWDVWDLIWVARFEE